MFLRFWSEALRMTLQQIIYTDGQDGSWLSGNGQSSQVSGNRMQRGWSCETQLRWHQDWLKLCSIKDDSRLFWFIFFTWSHHLLSGDIGIRDRVRERRLDWRHRSIDLYVSHSVRTETVPNTGTLQWNHSKNWGSSKQINWACRDKGKKSKRQNTELSQGPRTERWERYLKAGRMPHRVTATVASAHWKRSAGEFALKTNQK